MKHFEDGRMEYRPTLFESLHNFEYYNLQNVCWHNGKYRSDEEKEKFLDAAAEGVRQRYEWVCRGAPGDGDWNNTVAGFLPYCKVPSRISDPNGPECRNYEWLN